MKLVKASARYVLIIALVGGAGGCGGGDDGSPSSGQGGAPVVEDPGPIHVHGLGINPRDGALFIATHSGVFRVGPQDRKAERVAGRYQDTMGFAVIGPDRFLGSGHPDGREELPAFLGLIESADAAESWKSVSLQGKIDFHVLEAAGRRVYGFGSDFDSREELFLVSSDGGRDWKPLPAPESLVDLAVDPDDPEHLVASGARALHASADGGRSWTRVPGRAGYLGWPISDRLLALDPGGGVRVSTDVGGRWEDVGDIGGQPAAFLAESDSELYAALHDGTIKTSSDGGATWTVRWTP